MTGPSSPETLRENEPLSELDVEESRFEKRPAENTPELSAGEVERGVESADVIVKEGMRPNEASEDMRPMLPEEDRRLYVESIDMERTRGFEEEEEAEEEEVDEEDAFEDAECCCCICIWSVPPRPGCAKK